MPIAKSSQVGGKCRQQLASKPSIILYWDVQENPLTFGIVTFDLERQKRQPGASKHAFSEFSFLVQHLSLIAEFEEFARLVAHLTCAGATAEPQRCVTLYG